MLKVSASPISIPAYQDIESLSKRLAVSRSRVQEILMFLCDIGLAKEDRGRYTIGPKEIHLSKSSPNASRHLVNWRVHSMAKLGDNADDLHYSATLTMSKADAKRVRETLFKALEDVLATVQQSPEEEGFVYSFDFFKI